MGFHPRGARKEAPAASRSDLDMKPPPLRHAALNERRFPRTTGAACS